MGKVQLSRLKSISSSKYQTLYQEDDGQDRVTLKAKQLLNNQRPVDQGTTCVRYIK